jgi:hypothetical protein
MDRRFRLPIGLARAMAASIPVFFAINGPETRHGVSARFLGFVQASQRLTDPQRRSRAAFA